MVLQNPYAATPPLWYSAGSGAGNDANDESPARLNAAWANGPMEGAVFPSRTWISPSSSRGLTLPDRDSGSGSPCCIGVTWRGAEVNLCSTAWASLKRHAMFGPTMNTQLTSTWPECSEPCRGVASQTSGGTLSLLKSSWPDTPWRNVGEIARKRRHGTWAGKMNLP